ncbi:MAG: ferrous iron transport protein A [Burkholderiaceae bacterium]|nr:ferrous iron transport protein A [Burkholderiaceae bacterium]
MAALVAASLALTGLPKNAPARVLRVTHHGELADRLHDLGFIAGEAVRVVAQAIGGDPIAVRVGHSTFALRRAEAAGVLVQPDGRDAE